MEFEGAGEVGSRDNLKQSLAASSGDKIWIRRVPAEGEITVRFLTEPDRWFEFYEHFGRSVKSYYACIGKDNACPGCNSDDEESQRRSKRYLANVLDVEAGRVIPLLLPLDLVNRLDTRFERFETMMDRDYTLSRTGKGLNTIYDLDAGTPDSLDVSRYEDELIDLKDKLVEQFNDAWGDMSDPTPRKVEKKEEKKEPEEDTDTGEDEVYTLEDLEKMKVAELEEIAQRNDVEVSDDMKKAEIIDALVKAAG